MNDLNPIPKHGTGPNQDNTTDPVLQYMDYRHLPPNLQETSKLFAALAAELVRKLPRCPQRTTALNLLVQAKDCAVRASLPSKTITVDELAPETNEPTE